MPLFIPIKEVVEMPLLANDDYLQRGKGRMYKWAPHVAADLNITTLKVAVRRLISINKRTNSIDLPENTYKVCSVEVMDCNGVKYPVWLSDTLSDDLVEIGAAKDCACEHKCGGTLCNTIKGYVAVTSVKSDTLPNGSPISFTCVDRQAVDANGFFYSETQYPLRVYTTGTWVNTVLHTEQTKLCQVEVDSNGCICDTAGNLDALCNACGANLNNLAQAPAVGLPVGGNAQSFCNDPSVNSWIYYCSDKLDWFSSQCGGKPLVGKNIYNISEDGKRLIFPSNFGYEKAVVRTYQNVDLKNLQIPFLAVDTFVMGLLWWDTKFNHKMQALSNNYAQKYAAMKWGLLSELNKWTLAEQRMILARPAFVPSYIVKRH